MGCHRLSEIAGRLEKPATQLNRLLNMLIDLAYIKREIPYGTSVKSSKRSLYKISDPFMNFYFTFIVPNKSRLEYGFIEQIWEEISGRFNHYISGIWEDLCRQAVPNLSINSNSFLPAQRWWGNGIDEKPVEIDVVAESVDKSQLLIGEVKWVDSISISSAYNQLKAKAQKLPFTQNQKIIYILFLKHVPKEKINGLNILTPKDIIGALK